MKSDYNIMLVVEGPDAVGKTTAVNQLADDISAKIVKGVRIPDRFYLMHSVLNDIAAQLMRTSCGLSAERSVIFDRWPLISDLIYEKFVYHQTSILESILPVLSGVLREAHIFIVFMDLDTDEIIKRYNERGDHLRTLDEILITQQAYRDFFSEDCPLPFYKLDVTGMTKQEVVDELRAFIEEEALYAENEKSMGGK